MPETLGSGRSGNVREYPNAVYPTGTSGSLNVGIGQVMQALHQLENLARSQGFRQLQITGTRLTGANPGGLVNITRNLK